MSTATFNPLSQQFDATRDEIVAAFRERVLTSKRVKLTSQQLEELIDIFITRLTSLPDSESIKQLCQAEIALLEEGYPPSSVGKNYLPKYRKAIADAISSQRLKLNERNSHQYTYFKDGEEHLATEHWALTYLKYSQAEYEQFAQSTTSNNNLKQDSLQPVNPHLYLEQASTLLDSDEPLEVAIALAAVTGRRYSEIMARGHFEPTGHSYQIRFSGQLKKRGPVDSYTTFTLVPTAQVLAALERFRSHPTISALQDASIAEINKLNTPINRLVKRHFQDTELVTVLVGEAGVTIQNLRSIYGEIAVYFFCPTDLGVHRFIQQRLGHLISDPELAHGKNSGSTEHYFHYYLIDEQGQQLADKGIRRQSKQPKHPQQPKHLQQSEPSPPTPPESIQQLELLNTDLDTLLDTINSTSPTSPTSTVPSSPPVMTTPTSVDPQSSFSAGAFLRHITSLINRDDYQSLLVGLMAATGLDAASLLKLLVFKQASAPHLILYCHQLHPPHQPLQQLITLLPAADVLEAISHLRRHRDALDFAHRLTGSEINTQVAEFTPTVLTSIGLDSHLNLSQQYTELIPLLLKESITGDDQTQSTLSLSPATQHQLDKWQQHFAADVDATLNELMRLAAIALQSPQPSSHPTTSEPSPWLAISRLTETVAHLTSQVMAQNNRLLNLQFPSSTPSPQTLKPSSQHPIKPKTTPTKVSTPSAPSTTPQSNADILEPRPSPLEETPKSSNGDQSSLAHRQSLMGETPALDSSFKRGNPANGLSRKTALADLTSDELRTSRAPGAPKEKLARAFNAIVQYNQQQSEPKHMWRINTHILQQLTGCFNSSVQQFVRQHQSAIDEHNQQFNLTTVRHNSVHKGLDQMPVYPLVIPAHSLHCTLFIR